MGTVLGVGGRDPSRGSRIPPVGSTVSPTGNGLVSMPSNVTPYYGNGVGLYGTAGAADPTSRVPGGGGAAAAAAAPAAAPTATQALSSVATAAPNPQQAQALNDTRARLASGDPLLAENIQNVRNRMSSDTTGRAIQVANSGVDDSLAGAQQRAREAAARNGTEGNTAPQMGALEETAQRAKAGQGAQIALGREGQLDSLALGANAAYTNPSSRELSLLGLEGSGANAIAGQQSTALSQALDAWRAQQQVQLTREAQAQQAAQAQTAAALSLYNSLWR